MFTICSNYSCIPKGRSLAKSGAEATTGWSLHHDCSELSAQYASSEPGQPWIRLLHAAGFCTKERSQWLGKMNGWPPHVNALRYFRTFRATGRCVIQGTRSDQPSGVDRNKSRNMFCGAVPPEPRPASTCTFVVWSRLAHAACAVRWTAPIDTPRSPNPSSSR